MKINGHVLSTEQDRHGETILKISTTEIEDNIDWVGAEVIVAKPEYGPKEDDIDWTGY